MSEEMKEAAFDLIIESLRVVMDEVDELDELHDKAMLIDSILAERESLLEARMAAI